MKKPQHLPLDGVLNEPVPFDVELSFALSELDREPLLEITPVRMEGEVSRIEQGFALAAGLRYSGRLECSRCLAAYPFETDERFSIVLYKRPAAIDTELTLERNDLDVSFYDDSELPLAPIAEERIQMAIPMKPLCQENCRGLCAGCGADLNTQPCRCAAPAGDFRWEALRQIPRND